MTDKKIKILIAEAVCDFGGVSRYVLSLASYLPREKFEVHVASSPPVSMFPFLKQQGVITHRMIIDYSWISFLPAVFALRRLLKREKFDIVHANTARAGFLCAWAAEGIPVKTVYAGHGWRFSQKKFKVQRAVFLTLERFIAARSDTVVCLNEYEYRLGIEKGLIVAGQAAIIPMSIDEKMFPATEAARESARQSLGIPKDSVVVGTLGRITFQKYPEFFVEVAALLRKRIPGAIFLWVGEGELERKMRAMAARRGLAERLIFSGRRDWNEVPALLAAMDVFLFTSRFECLPTSVLEAMAAEKLIVAPAIDGIPDLLGGDPHCGLLYNPGDADDAASLIYKSESGRKKEFADIGKRARERILRDFSPKEKMSSSFAELYESLVANRAISRLQSGGYPEH